MKTITRILLLLLGITFGKFSIAQIDSALIDSLVDTIYFESIVFFEDETVKPGQLYPLYLDDYPEDTSNNLVQINSWTDTQLGLTHYKYQQFHDGLRVEGAEYIEHAYNGYLVFANGMGVETIEQSDSYELNEGTALNILLREFENDTFAWQDTSWEKQIKLDLNNSSATFYPEGELLWALVDYDYSTVNIPDENYRLAWKFDIFRLSPFDKSSHYVDAVNGDIIKSISLQKTDGPATIPHHGNVTIDTRAYTSGGFQLFSDNTAILSNIHTRNYAGTGSGTPSTWSDQNDVTDSDDNWGTGNQTSTATHWMADQTWRFYYDNYGRIGIHPSHEVRILSDYPIGTGGQSSIGNVHYLSFGYDDTSYMGLLDVVAHEYTHGVTEETSDLVYEKEPGALNESFSDIVGELVEQQVEGTNDWTIGEDGVLVRNLADPKSMSTPDPDTYEGLYWTIVDPCKAKESNDECGVHSNSGVHNFMFFLLSEGGTGTNDNGDNYVVNGIGTEAALDIIYYAFTNILTSNSGYKFASISEIVAANILFGDCSHEAQDVHNAWQAVGITHTNSCPTSTVEEKQIEYLEIISIYPNPSSDLFKLKLSDNFTGNIEIIDALGRTLHAQNINNQKIIELYTSSLPKGVYFTRLINRNIQLTDRIIIMK